MKDLDRRLSVVPMMDWTDAAEMSGSARSYDRDLSTALSGANGWSESDASSMSARIIDWRDSDDESKEGGDTRSRPESVGQSGG